jgi:hypothetical protein
LWLFGTSISGPLIGITSSMNIAMFIARGSHGRGQRLVGAPGSSHSDMPVELLI